MPNYSFTYTEINYCYECPFFYDYIYCQIDTKRKRDYCEYTDRDKNERPKWCKLKEI